MFEWKKKSCSIDGKCPNFSLRLYLRTPGELMLANFGLKIWPFWDSDHWHENWYSHFSRKQKAFWENNLHQITYLPKRYLWTKNEGNRFFNSCHSMVDISWPSLLILLNSITLKSNLIVSGIQWLIKCPFCREPVLHPFSGLFISKSCLSPRLS